MLTPESTKVFESCARTAHTDSRDLSPSHQNPCYRLRSRVLPGRATSGCARSRQSEIRISILSYSPACDVQLFVFITLGYS
ncbi:hypothetical protein I7I50_05899 [Histoplasma capsulatum G186AR]|uniref:Uncharacterized protein n=1 Tax=Ajellomyces capsulatus TaxID=5037 RepID=A0A8H7Z7G0_AJECA|nr:hypothetical protein I7I52_04158 [Histoplasma capsulatum]QSS76446.1 hypothetical protein I7I50_05899 [Histoplasma capsulatum G186AR]